jgi:hypothetical protein
MFTYHQPVQSPKLIIIESYVTITIKFVQLTLAHLYCYNEIEYKNILPLRKLQQKTNVSINGRIVASPIRRCMYVRKVKLTCTRAKNSIKLKYWKIKLINAIQIPNIPKLQQILDLYKRNKLHQILELQILVHDIWSLRFYINKHKKSKQIQLQTSSSSKQELQFIHVNNVFQMP